MPKQVNATNLKNERVVVHLVAGLATAVCSSAGGTTTFDDLVDISSGAECVAAECGVAEHLMPPGNGNPYQITRRQPQLLQA